MTKARRFNFRRSAAAFAVATAAFFAAPAYAATVSGTTGASVVWISAPKAVPKPIAGVVINKDRSFIPPLTVIPVGSTVRFPNEDPFYHSIYSTSPAGPFDIGFYDTGPGKVVLFAHPGIVELHCHIHVSMHAAIVVADGPYALVEGGTYRLADVPPGRYTLHAWDEEHGDRAVTVVVPDRGDVTLDIRP